MVKVLVVDDELSVREIFSLALRFAGCEVIEAEDGELAVEALTRESFDVMIIDLRMPNLNGREVVHRVRNGDLPLNTSIKIITTSADELSADDELRKLATVVLCKPIDVVKLRDMVTGFEFA